MEFYVKGHNICLSDDHSVFVGRAYNSIYCYFTNNGEECTLVLSEEASKVLAKLILEDTSIQNEYDVETTSLKFEQTCEEYAWKETADMSNVVEFKRRG